MRPLVESFRQRALTLNRFLDEVRVRFSNVQVIIATKVYRHDLAPIRIELTIALSQNLVYREVVGVCIQVTLVGPCDRHVRACLRA